MGNICAKYLFVLFFSALRVRARVCVSLSLSSSISLSFSHTHTHILFCEMASGFDCKNLFSFPSSCDSAYQRSLILLCLCTSRNQKRPGKFLIVFVILYMYVSRKKNTQHREPPAGAHEKQVEITTWHSCVRNAYASNRRRKKPIRQLEEMYKNFI